MKISSYAFRNIFLPALVGISLTSILAGFLYLGDQGSQNLRHDSIHAEINRLHAKSAAVDQEMIKSRFRLNASFDPLVKATKALKVASTDFGKKEQIEKEPAIQEAWKNYSKVLKSKSFRIEFFKSRNALLKLFLDHFPLGINQAITAVKARPDRQQIRQALTTLLQAVLSENLHLNGQFTSSLEILERLEKIHQKRPLNAETISVMAHTKRIHKLQGELTDVTSNALGPELQTKLGLLAKAFESLHAEEQKQANKFQSLTLFISFLLGIALIWFILRLTIAGRDLSNTLKELEFQKYALDQHAIVSTSDADGNITYVNDKFCEISEYSKEELISQNHRVVKSDQHSDAFFEFIWQQISSGQVWHGQIMNCKKNGGIYWVASTIVPLLDENGLPFQYISIRTDITKQKRQAEKLKHHEAELQEAKDFAEQATKAKSDFLANMSHEIRTPMNGIIGMTQLCLKTNLNKKQTNYLNKVNISAQLLLTIINDILDFSKIEAQKLEMESVHFNLAEVLENVGTSITTLARSKGLDLRYNIEPGITLELTGDALRLTQVLINLLSNSVKFTEHGSVSLAIHELRSDLETVWLEFQVSDTGIGIGPEKQETLFQPFTQADISTTRRFGGTGLGLTISKWLVEAMGGEISLKSVQGEGTTFTFNLPLAKSNLDENITLPKTLEGLEILVVDDNKMILQYMETLLSPFPLNLTFVKTGEAALEIMKSTYNSGNKFDLLLLDWKLTGMDGLEVSQLIRENLNWQPQPKIVMVTGTDRTKMDHLYDIDCLDAALIKPVGQKILIQTILELFNQQPAGQSPLSLGLERAAQLMDGNSLEGGRVLLVEDIEINKELAKELLEDHGLIVSIASNGQEAVNMWEKSDFDLILMDIQMPVMDGHKATETIRQKEKEQSRPPVPITAMTAHAYGEDQEKSKQAGMDDYLTKPIFPDKLEHCLRRWIPPNRTATIAKLKPGSSPSTPSQTAITALPAIEGGNLTDALQRAGGKTEKLKRKPKS